MKYLVHSVTKNPEDDILFFGVTKWGYDPDDIKIQFREQVIENIKSGDEYYTFIDRNLGSLLKIVRGKYYDYLRTDRNQTEEDNLDEIPLLQIKK